MKNLTFPDRDLNPGFLNKFPPTIWILREIRSIELTVLKKSRLYPQMFSTDLPNLPKSLGYHWKKASLGVRSPWVGRFLWRFYWQISTNLDESYIGRESSGGRTSTLALKYFATVKKFKIQMLYKMYKLDFKMFDYDIQPYLGVGRDWIKKYVCSLFR